MSGDKLAELPVLYSFRRCPYAMRARLALRVAAQPVALREVVLRDKPASMLSASAKATVPVLVLQDGVIDESLAIMRWSLARDDPQDWLAPQIGSLAVMLDLIGECDGSFKYHLDRYKYAARYTPAGREEHRREAATFLTGLQSRLVVSRYLFGARPALADWAIVPFVRQYANADRAWFDAQDWPQLRVWLDGLVDSVEFAAVMRKYPSWRVGDPVTVFPFC